MKFVATDIEDRPNQGDYFRYDVGEDQVLREFYKQEILDPHNLERRPIVGSVEAALGNLLFTGVT